MLTLFPQYRIGLGVGWVATGAAAGLMIQTGAAWYWVAALVLVCGFAALAITELAAASQHQRLLMILYQKGDPDGFIKVYEPLLRELLAVREGRPCDTAAIRTASEKAVSPIRRADMLLELGMALEAEGKRKEAVLILRRAVGGNTALWSVRQAKEMLAQLETDTGKKTVFELN